ncbi:DeoR/GlpR family DNA-binding transcription regulator [Alicyclobacillus sacchari]|uniref:DeoR/GlpR family DNA-binding transcription regulator n=1 Tax=Alicyclobacillus sacchari TaxID=392010 RepID=UPI0024E15DE3|nr:DeoR/GlpR family DNA-binding transcription regulator [Alicyclobacillus sacchari]
MFADERKAQIATYVQTHKSATVSMLAQMLATSESTIRRDLQELEEHGQLRRTHGGAIAVEVASFEPTWQEKHVRHAEEKARIARCAVKRIAPGQTVLLDGGTTTYQIAKQLSVDGVTVITNSVDIASELTAKAGVHLVVLGGEFRNTTARWSARSLNKCCLACMSILPSLGRTVWIRLALRHPIPSRQRPSARWWHVHRPCVWWRIAASLVRSALSESANGRTSMFFTATLPSTIRSWLALYRETTSSTPMMRRTASDKGDSYE